MLKSIFKLLLIGVVFLVGYTAFRSYQKGYFNIPDIPDGAYVISTGNGLRGILLDAEVSQPIHHLPNFFRRLIHADPDRIYFGFPADVAPWFVDTWSICTAPSRQERIEFENATLPQDIAMLTKDARFDAICRFDVDGKEITRGLLFSVPRI